MNKEAMRKLKSKLLMIGEPIGLSNDFSILTYVDDSYRVYRLNSDGTVNNKISKNLYERVLVSKYFLILSIDCMFWDEIHIEKIDKNILDILNKVDHKVVRNCVVSSEDYPVMALTLEKSFMIITADGVAYDIKHKELNYKIWNSARISTVFNASTNRYEFMSDILFTISRKTNSMIFGYMDKDLKNLVIMDEDYTVEKIVLRNE